MLCTLLLLLPTNFPRHWGIGLPAGRAFTRDNRSSRLTVVFLGLSLLIAAIWSSAVAAALAAGGMWFIWTILCRCNVDAVLFADYALFEAAAAQLVKKYKSTGGQTLVVKLVKQWRTIQGFRRFLVLVRTHYGCPYYACELVGSFRGDLLYGRYKEYLLE